MLLPVDGPIRLLEHNFFSRYPGIGTVLHWRDTEMKNLLATLPYYLPSNLTIYYGGVHQKLLWNIHGSRQWSGSPRKLNYLLSVSLSSFPESFINISPCLLEFFCKETGNQVNQSSQKYYFSCGNKDFHTPEVLTIRETTLIILPVPFYAVRCYWQTPFLFT